MTAADLYQACPIKRARRTRADIEAIRREIVSVLTDHHPMSVRQVYYQLVVRGAIEKTEDQYQSTVIRLLTEMRLDDTIPFQWITDDSRRRVEYCTHDSLKRAVDDCARYYRRNALNECPDYIEIWTEKEALVGFIHDAAGEYDVPVIPTKGMPSITQLYRTAVQIKHADDAGKVTFIYQFGDHDPTGVIIPETIERRLEEFCDKLECEYPTHRRGQAIYFHY